MQPAADSSAPAPGLTRGERLRMVALFSGIGVVTVLAFLAAFAYLPHHYSQEATPGALIFSGLAITAYILGLRHGFDADHIAAIDNTTRKLLNDGKRPLTVGTWFSLGHSTIVFALIAALVVVTEYVRSHVAAFAQFGAIVGALVSGVFLFLIGLVNVLIAIDVYRIFRGLRDRELDQAALDAEMDKRGFLYRYFGRLFKMIREPWQIYPIGVLFGLGFDTATEVLLITVSVVFATTASVPFWAVLLLPLLFTCGMVLADTADGLAMRYAYGWAFLKPIRKIYYNLTLTVISVLVAFVVGGIEVLGVVGAELGLHGWFWSQIGGLNFEVLGLAIVVVFLGSWLIAMGIYRYNGYEQIAFGPGPPTVPSP
ncbi:MAG: HoxN/HupN/NixA family nickel/cobalt transporter [Thermoplasmata archaeon]|nr:HoxN/HupN/NixA family nickel/cobalt transporter [Thermoplasmata archaeon]